MELFKRWRETSLLKRLKRNGISIGDTVVLENPLNLKFAEVRYTILGVAIPHGVYCCLTFHDSKTISYGFLSASYLIEAKSSQRKHESEKRWGEKIKNEFERDYYQLEKETE